VGWILIQVVCLPTGDLPQADKTVIHGCNSRPDLFVFLDFSPARESLSVVMNAGNQTRGPGALPRLPEVTAPMAIGAPEGFKPLWGGAGATTSNPVQASLPLMVL